MAKELKEEKRLLLKNASLFKRLFAYLIDIFIVSFFAMFFLRDKFSVSFSQLALFDMNNIAPEFLNLSYYLSFSLFFYFVMCELFTKQTIGKTILNLYVVSIDQLISFNDKINNYMRLNKNKSSVKNKKIAKEDNSLLKKDIVRNEADNEIKVNANDFNNLFIGKLGFFQGIIRSLYLIPFFSFISSFDIISIFFTKHKQRIFEYISGSTVVEVSYEEHFLV